MEKNQTWLSFSSPLLKIVKKFAFLQPQKDFDEFNECYLQNGGLGVALLSVTTNAKLRFSPFLATLAANRTFVSGFFTHPLFLSFLHTPPHHSLPLLIVKFFSLLISDS